MVARYSAAGFGLFAFAVSVFAGIAVGNPVRLILSRSILALFAFFVLGLLLGAAADAVVRERTHSAQNEAQQPLPRQAEESAGSGSLPQTMPSEGGSSG